MNDRVRCAVLISGRGSNLGALIDAAKDPSYPGEIVLVISNKKAARGIKRALAEGIPTLTIEHESFDSRESFDEAIDTALQASNVSLVCEAGFTRIHSESFVRRWEGRLINIHPSLLPAFKGAWGRRVHEEVLAAGASTTGCTVHFLVPEVDAGPIIGQIAVPVLPGDDVATLSARVLEAEHALYPRALRLVAEGKVRLERGQAVFA